MFGIIAECGHYSRISTQSERNFSAIRTAWRRECDSNSHYRFEFRNPRRLRNLQAEQHLTRESTRSDWPPVDKKQSIFSSAHQGERHTILWLKVVTFVPWQGADIGCAMTTCLGAQSRLRSLSAQRAAKRQINRDSQRFLPVLFGELPAFWPEKMRFHLCDLFRVVRRRR